MLSQAHIEELAYRAVRHALFPAGFPRRRGADGRFISRKAETTERLRGELAAHANEPLADAIERLRSVA